MSDLEMERPSDNDDRWVVSAASQPSEALAFDNDVAVSWSVPTPGSDSAASPCADVLEQVVLRPASSPDAPPDPARGAGAFTRRARGRPKGTPGNPAQRLAMRAQAQAAPPPLALLPTQPPSEEALVLQTLFRPIGTGVLHDLVMAARANVHTPKNSRAEAILDRTLGDLPRTLANFTAEA